MYRKFQFFFVLFSGVFLSVKYDSWVRFVMSRDLNSIEAYPNVQFDVQDPERNDEDWLPEMQKKNVCQLSTGSGMNVFCVQL